MVKPILGGELENCQLISSPQVPTLHSPVGLVNVKLHCRVVKGLLSLKTSGVEISGGETSGGETSRGETSGYPLHHTKLAEDD